MQDRPELFEDLTYIWQAFARLNRARPVGFEVEPIPLSEVQAWLDLEQIDDPEERLFVAAMIDAMDQEYLEWVERRRQRRQDETQRPKKDR